VNDNTAGVNRKSPYVRKDQNMYICVYKYTNNGKQTGAYSWSPKIVAREVQTRVVL